jgi:hypothetical protein
MCNPTSEHGPANGHRDIHPVDQAPVGELARDFLQPGCSPAYLALDVKVILTPPCIFHL